MSESGSENEEQEQEQELDLSNSDVVTKYKAAAEITNAALAKVAGLCKAGAKVVDISEQGDLSIIEAAGKVFRAKKGGKEVEKGLAFPTCVSVNSVVGHNSPSAEDTTELKEGDVVKIDLASHIDGFIATAAHTVVVQPDGSASATGRAADVIQAAQTALEAAVRLFRPGKTSTEISATLQKVAEAYGCTLVEGVLSHQLKQFIIDGNKCVLNRPGPDARVEDVVFEENEVYGIDILVSTGEGKSRVIDERETTVFKRALDETYHLKMKAARSVFSEINRKFPAMPFTLRAIEGRGSRLGLVECLNHGLLHAYPVLHEKSGELVAQAKATVLLMPNGSDRITSAPAQSLSSEKQIEDEDLKRLLQTSLKTKKKGKKKSGKAGAAPKKDEEGETEAEADKTDGEADRKEGEPNGKASIAPSSFAKEAEAGEGADVGDADAADDSAPGQSAPGDSAADDSADLSSHPIRLDSSALGTDDGRSSIDIGRSSLDQSSRG